MSSFNTKKFIKNCTVVSPMSVALFSNAMRLSHDPISKVKGKLKIKYDLNLLNIKLNVLYHRR